MKAFLPLLLALLAVPAQAIDPGYARQLERAGCTQMSELQGCDIRRSRAENERAGFKAGQPVTPYAGRWLARHQDGRPVARIRIDGTTPVRVTSRAQLEPQGITGLNYIQITAGEPSSALLKTQYPDNVVPVIWTSNCIADVDPAILRRFSLSIRMDFPGVAHSPAMLDRVSSARS